MTLSLPAPAKLNLFMHILGQRPDGYHNLETVFQFVDWCDTLHFSIQDAPDWTLDGNFDGIPAEQNLITHALDALVAHTGVRKGLTVAVEKVLPMGGGLGGGSSNAATTLFAANALWELGLDLPTLKDIGVRLGADVPIFLHAHAAFATGIGETLEDLHPPTPYYVLVIPPVEVPTPLIFGHKNLTRGTPPIRIEALNWSETRNDAESLVSSLFPEVQQALSELSRYAPARLTGTGGTVFAAFDSLDEASKIADKFAAPFRAVVCKGHNVSPLVEAARHTESATVFWGVAKR